MWQWRGLLTLLCMAAFVQLGLVVWMQEAHTGALPGFALPYFAYTGAAPPVRLLPTDRPLIYRFVVPRGNALLEAGIRDGDLLDLRTASLGMRFRWGYKFWWSPGTVDATLLRGDRDVVVPLTVSRARPTVYARLATAGGFWSLLFAAILVWRRSNAPEARAFALLLILVDVANTFQPSNWITPWPLLDCILDAASWPLSGAGICMLAVYAMLFARPANPLRRGLAIGAYVSAILLAGAGLAQPLLLMAWPGEVGSPSWDTTLSTLWSLSWALPLLCAIATIAYVRGPERTRLTWAAVPLLPLYATAAILPFGFWLSALSGFFLNLVDLGVFVAPLGLTYSLLSRRLLDIGFALNRAAIFAATSLILAGLFAGLQWATNAFVTGLVQVHNVVANMAIVVIVYYVARGTRARTEQLITRLFFAGRDRRLRALRTLLRSVDDVTDADAIAPFAIQCLRSRAEIEARLFLPSLEGANFVEAGGADSTAPAIPLDHVAMVTLRATREPLRAPEWEALGAVAFPMLVRGQVRGILFCSDAGGSDFAPDEMQLLELLANRLATDRDDLLAATLREEAADLRRRLHALGASQRDDNG